MKETKFIYPICSSSKGNAIYAGTRESGILFDCGIGIRSLTSALKLRDISLSAIQAVFVTHEHSDHIKGLFKLSEAIPISVYGNVATLKELIAKNAIGSKAKLKEINKKPAIVEDMELVSFRTSHDSADSMGYRLTFENGKRFALSTDLGYVSEEVDCHISQSDLLLIESNYDDELLRNGSYPWFLKQRIQGERGHLSNDACAEELARLVKSGVRHFVLGHLSEENNRPELALQTSMARLVAEGMKPDSDFTLSVAPPRTLGKVVEL